MTATPDTADADEIRRTRRHVAVVGLVDVVLLVLLLRCLWYLVGG